MTALWRLDSFVFEIMWVKEVGFEVCQPLVQLPYTRLNIGVWQYLYVADLCFFL